MIETALICELQAPGMSSHKIELELEGTLGISPGMFLHVTGKESETQSKHVTCPRSPSQSEVGQGSNPDRMAREHWLGVNCMHLHLNSASTLTSCSFICEIGVSTQGVNTRT